jgi:alpha-amylase/alpha-mannosidase (GH57 family)
MFQDGTLGVAIIWHMHQPYYGVSGTNNLFMPWVRLHGTKDYYDMAAILSEHPEVKVTFNFVPSLLKQIRMYTDEGISDYFLDLSLKDPKKLSKKERLAISDLFFMIHPKCIEPFPRYKELYRRWRKWKEGRTNEELFTLDDISDLQLLFNLAWFDPTLFGDSLLKSLINKGRGFSSKDKQALRDKTLEILSEIIPLYRRLSDRGQIELSTSPFYHPIMPLLYDSDVAIVAFPDTVLPGKPFRAPEDIESHISRSVSYHEDVFGKTPLGIWPSEGSVSQDIVPYLISAGINWIATDEAILQRSIESLKTSKVMSNNTPVADIYQPYRFLKDDREIVIFFRDRYISDQISFSYYNMSVKESMAHLKSYFNKVAEIASSAEIKLPLVTIILDGENPWENYDKDGLEFLHGLYDLLESDPQLTSITPSDYISEVTKGKRKLKPLKKLSPGSWIGGNFRIWLGHRENNKAWDLLRETRDFLVKVAEIGNLDGDTLSEAWEEIYIAEGSDWFWWYGDDYSSEMDSDFDMLFRIHLKRVYEIAGEEPPEQLSKPISARGGKKQL